MDHTPQPESKHDSEVPIFSVSTAEEDDDVEEEYVEEEEDEDLDDYDEESYELSLAELSNEIRQFRKFKKTVNSLSSAFDHFDRTSKAFRARTKKEITTLAAKVDMVHSDQSANADDIKSLYTKTNQVEHAQEVYIKTNDKRLDKLEEDHKKEVETRTESSKELKQGQQDLNKALGIIETQQKNATSLPSDLEKAFQNALVNAFQTLQAQGLFGTLAGTPATQAQPPTPGGQLAHAHAASLNPVICNQFQGTPRETLST